MMSDSAAPTAIHEVRELLQRLDQHDHERDDEAHVEGREQPAAREQEAFEQAFQHRSRVQPIERPDAAPGPRRERQAATPVPIGQATPVPLSPQ
jgi:hypothetical protein